MDFDDEVARVEFVRIARIGSVNLIIISCLCQHSSSHGCYEEEDKQLGAIFHILFL